MTLGATPGADRVSYCDACGASNDADRATCRICGRSLTHDTAANAELPPIPDGGLRESMPTWLRDPLPPDGRESPTPPAYGAPSPAAPAPAGEPEIVDPRTFLTDEDLPAWIRRLAASPADRSSGRPANGHAPALPRSEPAPSPRRTEEPALSDEPSFAPAPTPALLPLWLIVAAILVAIVSLVVLIALTGAG